VLNVSHDPYGIGLPAPRRGLSESVLFRVASYASWAGAAITFVGFSTPSAPIQLHFLRYVVMLPVVLALHQAVYRHAPRLSELTLILAIAGIIRFLIVDPLVMLGGISWYQATETQHLGWLAIYGWFIPAHLLAARFREIPRVLAILGILVGTLYVVGGVIGGSSYFSGWRDDPSLLAQHLVQQRLSITITTGATFLYLFWAAWLGEVLWRKRDREQAVVTPGRGALIEPILALVLVIPLLLEQPRTPRPDFNPAQYVTGLDDYDCEDFASQADAQVVLRMDPRDLNRLDPYRGGVACGENPSPVDWVIVRRP
jgi:hypothetical protein